MENEKSGVIPNYEELNSEKLDEITLKTRRAMFIPPHLSDPKLSYYKLDNFTKLGNSLPEYKESDRFVVYNINDAKIQYELNKKLSRLESKNPIVRFFWRVVYWIKYHLIKRH